MGIWIEFRCENRDEESAKGGYSPGTHCESHDNSGPMGLAYDTQADVIDVVRDLAEHAKRAGWVKTKSGWHCEHCAKKLGLTPNKK